MKHWMVIKSSESTITNPMMVNNKHCEKSIKFSFTMKHWMVITSLESIVTSLQMVNNKPCHELQHHEKLDGQNKFRVHRHQSADGQNKNCEKISTRIRVESTITMKHWMVKTSIVAQTTILSKCLTYRRPADCKPYQNDPRMLPSLVRTLFGKHTAESSRQAYSIPLITTIFL